MAKRIILKILTRKNQENRSIEKQKKVYVIGIRGVKTKIMKTQKDRGVKRKSPLKK